MEPNRKFWNEQQKEFRRVLLSFEQHQEAIQLFLSQHAMVHSAKMVQSTAWSFEDEVLNDMTKDQIRRIPTNCEHSVAWLLWHIARIEDVTMNLLVDNGQEIFRQDQWSERIGTPVQNTGNAMSEEGVAQLSEVIDVEALLAYRLAVGRRTREIVQQLQPAELKQKVEPTRLQQLMDEGVVVEEARGLIDYWGRRDIAGLLLMPPTRHNFLHLNEASRLKKRR